MLNDHWMLYYKDLKITNKANGFEITKLGDPTGKPLEDPTVKTMRRSQLFAHEPEYLKESLAQYVINHYDELLSNYFVAK